MGGGGGGGGVMWMGVREGRKVYMLGWGGEGGGCLVMCVCGGGSGGWCIHVYICMYICHCVFVCFVFGCVCTVVLLNCRFLIDAIIRSTIWTYIISHVHLYSCPSCKGKKLQNM